MMKIASSYHSSSYSNSQDRPKVNRSWWDDHEDTLQPKDALEISQSTLKLQNRRRKPDSFDQKAKTKRQRQINLYRRNMFYT